MLYLQMCRGIQIKMLWALTKLTYAQFLSKRFGVAFGLINAADGNRNEFAGSLCSRSHFMNVGMHLSPVVVGTAVPLLI